MSPIETSVKTRSVEHVDTKIEAAKIEYLQVDSPELVGAFWDAKRILGLIAEEDAGQRKEASVLPVTRITFTSPDGSKSFEATEGPVVNDLIKTDDEIASLRVKNGKSRKRKLSDSEIDAYKKARVIITSNSAPFWEVGDRNANGYRGGRIEAEKPAYLAKHPGLDEELKKRGRLPDGISAGQALSAAINKVLTNKIELVIPEHAIIPDAADEKDDTAEHVKYGFIKDTFGASREDESATGVSVLSEDPSNESPTERVATQVIRKKRRTGAVLLAGTLVAGVPAVTVADATNVLTVDLKDYIPGIGGNGGSKKVNLSGTAGAQLEFDSEGKPKAVIVPSAPQNELQPKAETQKETVKRTEEALKLEKMLKEMPWLIETVKNKAAVIADVADAHKIDAKFLAALVQVRTAGNSRAGDHEKSDSFGIVLISIKEAEKAGLSKNDLFDDRESLNQAAKMLRPSIEKNGLSTNEGISQVVLDFIGQKTGDPAWIAAHLLDTDPVSVMKAWSQWGQNQRIIRDARLSQGLAV